VSNDGERIPMETRARALAELVLGREKPSAIAERYGVKVTQLAQWRRALADDPELALATRAAIGVLLEGWRPAIRRLVTRLATALEQRLEKNPDAMDPAEMIGGIRALAEVVGQADALAARSEGDEDDLGARERAKERRLHS
jgi:transposase-like protein